MFGMPQETLPYFEEEYKVNSFFTEEEDNDVFKAPTGYNVSRRDDALLSVWYVYCGKEFIGRVFRNSGSYEACPVEVLKAEYRTIQQAINYVTRSHRKAIREREQMAQAMLVRFSG